MCVFVTGVKLSLVILQLCDKEDCEKYVMITLDDTLRCDDDALFWQKDVRIISLEISLALPLSVTDIHTLQQPYLDRF